MVSRFPLLSVALLFAGCATSPVATSDAVPVPESRLLSRAYSSPLPNTGAVTVKRDHGLAGAACSSRVSVDGVPVADVAVGEKVTLYLSIGAHLLSAKPNGLCGGGLTETAVAVTKAQPTYVRISYGTNGDFRIQPTAF